jgi:hypothetical protein
MSPSPMSWPTGFRRGSCSTLGRRRPPSEPDPEVGVLWGRLWMFDPDHRVPWPHSESQSLVTGAGWAESSPPPSLILLPCSSTTTLAPKVACFSRRTHGSSSTSDRGRLPDQPVCGQY